MPIVEKISDDKAPEGVKELFSAMIEAQGKVPEWMRVMAQCPDTLQSFFGLFKTLMDDAPADPKLKWKIAYRVSEINKCQYCVSVSVNMLKKLGIPEADIAGIKDGDGEKEKIVLEYAAQMTKKAYAVDPAVVEKMKKHFSDPEIVEITSVVGLFNYINRFNDALGVIIES